MMGFKEKWGYICLISYLFFFLYTKQFFKHFHKNVILWKLLS